MTNNKTVLDWIEKMVQLVKPDKVVWIDGSEEQLEALRATVPFPVRVLALRLWRND